ncbi:hypothetical protein N9A84_03260 [Gammaproteobacteria bacterium]|nr:hypothetical protein [Gammaproteobacteria bacterium]
MLGKYSTKVVLPKTKSELVKSINGLGQVEINVLEPIDKSNVGFVKSEIDRFVGNGKNDVSVVFIKKK